MITINTTTNEMKKIFDEVGIPVQNGMDAVKAMFINGSNAIRVVKDGDSVSFIREYND